MTSEIGRYPWSDLANAPASPGVYAWYYSPDIADYDLERAIAAAADGDPERSRDAIRSLLDERLFGFFREAAYDAVITGALKPSYSGQLTHAFDVSGSLVERLSQDPNRLRSIRDILRVSAPLFASPLYIGMATKLRSRLGRHKQLIERYRAAQPPDGQPVRESDAGFAWQVAKRRIPPERLFVCTCAISTDDGIAVDVENILNRIYYPVLGKN